MIKLDINKVSDFDILPKDKIHAVIDLIGSMSARMEGYHLEKYVQTNIIGTCNILKYNVQSNAKSFCDIRMEAENVLKPDKPNALQYIMDIKSAKNDLGYQLQYSYINMFNDMKIEREKNKF